MQHQDDQFSQRRDPQDQSQDPGASRDEQSPDSGEKVNTGAEPEGASTPEASPEVSGAIHADTTYSEHAPQASGADTGQTGDTSRDAAVASLDSQSSGSSNGIYYAVGAVVVIAAALLAWVMFGSSLTSGPSASAPESNSAAGGFASYPEVIAEINGEEVTKSEFEEIYNQALGAAEQQGLDTSDPAVLQQVEDRAIDLMVNTKLLVQAARDSGASASESAIDEQLAQLESQFGSAEALQARVDELGLTQEELREDVSEQLLVDDFLQETDEFSSVSVSDEDVQAFYENLQGQLEDAPPLSEITEDIRAQLEAQAEQAASGDVVDRLREDAEIDIRI